METMNRRSFLHRSALTAAALNTLPSRGLSAQSDDKLKLGLIGCGWWGMVDVDAAFKVGGVEVVALCDVDSAHLEESAAKVERLQGRRPKTFKNYEDLLR
jgi:predicted homoserine dehydrogenase-like protein